MINPSANGWIDKYFEEINSIDFSNKTDPHLLYELIRDTGFTFGFVTQLYHIQKDELALLKQDEISKLAMIEILFYTYNFNKKDANTKIFIESVIEFYNQLSPKNYNFIKKIINPSKNTQLENIIENRIQTNDDLVSKQFSNFATNAFLFIDILAFEHFLKTNKIENDYYQKIEEILIKIVMLTLQIKSNKSNDDDLLFKFFESSIRYSNLSKKETIALETLNLDFLTTNFEKYYLIDVAIIAVWSDSQIEVNEIYFLQKLAEKLELDANYITNCIKKSRDFIQNNKSEIPYFNSNKSIKKFYEQTNKSIDFIIKRNKKRLLKEILQSKELVILLSKSTKQELSDSEKKKIKIQLLDICKTIPSLTLFLLPGGGLLLPILVKFIPQILPSAFNENFEKKEN